MLAIFHSMTAIRILMYMKSMHAERDRLVAG